jgi:tRNA pseudouridine38-40 synthase
MQRYFIYFSYDGTNYHGWQIQPHDNSVQEVLQRSLSTLLRKETEVVGAGRTDAGVHARVMAAHFDWEGDGIDCRQLAYKLNRLLPKDISVDRVEQVDNEMHARFSATKRTYHYYIHTRKNPFLRAYSCEMHFPLDFELMNKAGEMLMEYEDFGAFCKSHTDVKTTICHVTEARWVQTGRDEWYFVISANRFLRNMVRAVVGTLVEVGRGRMTLDDFRQVVEGKSRSAAGESMPAHALFLEDVRY